jgi:hypothetical protein
MIWVPETGAMATLDAEVSGDPIPWPPSSRQLHHAQGREFGIKTGIKMSEQRRKSADVGAGVYPVLKYEMVAGDHWRKAALPGS